MASFDTIDAATADTILRLLLTDTEEVASKSKGKQKAGEATDAEYALEVFKHNLTEISKTFQSRIVAESIATAIRHDGELIQTLRQQDRQLHEDHQLALRTSGREASVPVNELDYDIKSNESTVELVFSDCEDQIDTAGECTQQAGSESTVSSSVYHSDDEYVDAESSAMAAARSEGEETLKITCVACEGSFDPNEVLSVPCQHDYCYACLELLFRNSMVNESLFPPRCCKQQIFLEDVKHVVNFELIESFEKKAVEFNTHNRTYCFEASCAEFIPPSAITGDIATCTVCRRTTCTSCKHVSHSGDCPEDEAVQQLLNTAETQRWQRCYSCGRLVELRSGCNHITCPCGAQFCYVCGTKWKACECAQWNENRLVERAAQLVDRDPGRRLFRPRRVAHAQPGDPQNKSRESRVAGAVERLRENHNCCHMVWEKLHGEHTCDMCDEWLKRFIFQCVQCQTLACNRCRRNRL